LKHLHLSLINFSLAEDVPYLPVAELVLPGQLDPGHAMVCVTADAAVAVPANKPGDAPEPDRSAVESQADLQVLADPDDPGDGRQFIVLSPCFVGFSTLNPTYTATKAF